MLFSPSCKEFNSLQKKIYSPLTYDQYFFQKIKSYGRVVGGKVDGQILFGARSDKPNILFGARVEKRKNLFGAK